MYQKNNFIAPTTYSLYFLILFVVVDIISRSLGNPISQHTQLDNVFLAVPVLMLIFHSFTTLPIKRGIFFIVLAATIGFVMEYLGLKTGTIFGGFYTYNENQPVLFDVPYVVMLYWAVFTYTGYSVVNALLYLKKKAKPQVKMNNWILLIALIILDAYVVTAIDLFMDPIQVTRGTWAWPAGGPYFGVPMGNFVGWFFVTVLITGTFRICEYLYPMKEETNDRLIIMIPVIAYALLLISFIGSAFDYGLEALIPYGIVFMAPVLVFILLLFIKNKKITS